VGAVAKSINLIIALTGNVHPDRSLVSILTATPARLKCAKRHGH